MTEPLERWRLMLGEASELGLGKPDLSQADLGVDAALAWLYDRDPSLVSRGIRGRAAGGKRGGQGPSSLTVPEWIDEIHRLFPRETIERLEKDAVLRYRIDEVVTNPEVLARVEPNPSLLQAVLRTKHLMNAAVLAIARQLVAKVVRDLMEKLAREVRAAFSGTRDRRARSLFKTARNFDARRTIKENLAHYDVARRKILIEQPRFFSRTRRHSTRWQVIVLVDESGSMLGSVVHAAVTAACLVGLPSIKTHLCIFDTEVVDLSGEAQDPVSVLMKVQLGGGTDIGRAVEYASSLIESPRRAIVVVISDFFEGGAPDLLVRRVKALCEQGTHVLGLAALDEAAAPSYDKELARRLVDAGAHVAAMTPGELAAWIAEKVRA
ncbi:MAG TPA: VWA domain-containing protein [Planctomycetota bacterium]|nr:VWA domain-containing protein [Planctomycetota bacterium]